MNDFFTDIFRGAPFLAILRGFSVERTLELATAAWDAGISAVEIPAQSPEAIETLRIVAAAGQARGAIVGAGTIISVDQVEAVRAAGARFTVAPGFDSVVAQASEDAGLAHLPGVGTASEIQAVLTTGRTWVKAFPADALGERWFAGMRGPFPHLNIVATGGMSADNAEQFLAAGANVISLGSALADPAQIAKISHLI
ncbi:2-dehydro-3-deoxyphosphogluconate aldolase/(4S)-4-hydroxy-2-oxoglutarate aldolase [Leucobacter exalbidus]|uniref:2-dehydro-3-deoxyphosphogluconate aldolase/(4S)-4-hydroxy-2-oxoglutarate aldolase n=1 Tax=Leucobacter exalbidus TaxID=662960 RepID=A0A940PLT4_9MICO|nr:bifunctional 4-hydroxy-2-oxoglutarate aldolase/2-dehydro-3-deoxy-phosphogluconate aldolase [Leucobacter exalbidus]MBP1326272.1 2-dehydro-3-deoxyphosphogluconate aldolase/(4S)-4-hydroxy-2-oxoglutarate aldolase [Leucobacter exalbidus]